MFANYYEVLGVDAQVDGEALRKAFRRCSWEAHPDRGGSTERMKLINEAWTVLSNRDLRDLYDKTRWGKTKSEGDPPEAGVGPTGQTTAKEAGGSPTQDPLQEERRVQQEAEQELWRYMEYHNRMNPGVAKYYADPKMATFKRFQKHLTAFFKMLKVVLLWYVIVFLAVAFLYFVFVESIE